MNSDRILVVSDSPDYYSTRDLRLLYPGEIDEFDLHSGPLTAAILAPYRKVWTLLRRVEALQKLDYRLLREHAQRTGARVVSHLLEYAHGSGSKFAFRNAESTRHRIQIVAESDPLTRGFQRGDSLYWYRNSTDIDEPPVAHYAWREVECADDPARGRTVLARSESSGNAVWVEERFESGGILFAADLFSPLDLCLTAGDPWILHRGCFNKYIPAGNLFGGTVRHGRYVNRKLSVEEVLARIRGLPDRAPRGSGLEVRDEGPSSDGTPVLSVRMGNPHGPKFFLMAAKHGTEWENVYGLLNTLEILARQDVLDLKRFGIIAIPLLNPFGYRHGTRQNANGVDLNRQLRKDWDTFRGWADEVLEPWTFDFKGSRRGGEPEAAIEARLRAEPGMLCVLDAHGMATSTVFGGSGPNVDVIRGIGHSVNQTLKNRYLIRCLTESQPRQLALDRHPGQTGDEDPHTPFTRRVDAAPYYDLYYENICQLPDVHATVLQTEFATEMNLSILRQIAASV